MSSHRMQQYIPLVQTFAARVVLLHDAAAGKVGLHATDVKVLRLLGDNEMTAGDLIDHTGLTGAAVTALIDRLEEAGYVKRERGPEDRRKVVVRSIPSKVKKLDHVYNDLSVKMAGFLSKYTDKEFATVIDYLTKTSEILAEQTKELRAEIKKPRKALWR